MMNGITVRKDGKYIARSGTKSAERDAKGICWSRETQAARMFKNRAAAERTARRIGGKVCEIVGGRAAE